jgi:hypothetical protein
MFKMSSHDPFGYLKHKLWSKERSGVNLSIWLSITKSQKSPWFPFMRWKTLDESYNFFLDLTSIGGLHIKLWPSKVAGVAILGIPELPLGTKWHLSFWPMGPMGPMVPWHKEYYKGEGDGFPQVRAVVSLMNPYLPVVRSCTKSVPTMQQLTCCLVCASPWE